MLSVSLERSSLGRVERFREAEFQHFDGAVTAHLDVRGFQIAVDDALPVRRLEGFGNLLCERQHSEIGIGPRAMPSASVGPSTSSITSAVVPPDFSRPWIDAMFG